MMCVPLRQNCNLHNRGHIFIVALIPYSMCAVACATIVPPVSSKQCCPQKLRSERECSLETPFGARDHLAKQQQHIPRHKTPHPFKVQSDGGLQLAIFSVEALVAVPLHAEKLNMLPGLGGLVVIGTCRSGTLIWLRDLWDGHRLYSISKICWAPKYVPS